MGKIVLDLKDEVYQKLMKGETIILKLIFVKERGEIFAMEVQP